MNYNDKEQYHNNISCMPTTVVYCCQVTAAKHYLLARLIVIMAGDCIIAL